MRTLACVMAILLALMVPANIAAQQVTDSFQDLTRRSLLEVGDEIWITCDLRGTGEYKESEAEVVALTDSSITISADVSVFGGEEQFVIPADRVRQVDTKRINRTKGALIGVAIGGGVGVLLALPVAALCEYEYCGAAFVGAIAVPAAAGAGIGAAIGRGQHVGAFAAPGTKIALAPILTRQQKGLSFTIEW